ncbi:MAG: hypothetical protein IPK60_21200 [Sandaracinaceae bacterium]|nr:hypothetical protein [Sandaracinaceae bacterium]
MLLNEFLHVAIQRSESAVRLCFRFVLQPQRIAEIERNHIDARRSLLQLNHVLAKLVDWRCARIFVQTRTHNFTGRNGFVQAHGNATERINFSC